MLFPTLRGLKPTATIKHPYGTQSASLTARHSVNIRYILLALNLNTSISDNMRVSIYLHAVWVVARKAGYATRSGSANLKISGGLNVAFPLRIVQARQQRSNHTRVAIRPGNYRSKNSDHCPILP